MADQRKDAIGGGGRHHQDDGIGGSSGSRSGTSISLV
jgi:hypothetical protein